MASMSLAAELSDMRQRVKAIESSKRQASTSSEDPQRIISAQRAQIDKLKRENQQLQEELSLDTKVHACRQWRMAIRCFDCRVV